MSCNTRPSDAVAGPAAVVRPRSFPQRKERAALTRLLGAGAAARRASSADHRRLDRPLSPSWPAGSA